MFSKALVIFSLISVAFATVFVIAPVASTTYSGGKSAVVSWQDDGNAPSLPLFGPSMISIYVGNALQQTNLQILSNSTDVSATSSITFTPTPTIGPNGDNYFIRFESINGKDKTSTPYEAFSAQFTLNGMTGTFSQSILAQIAGQSTAPLVGGQTSSGTTGPTSTPSLTTSTASNSATSASSTTSATAKATSGALGLKAGWAGIVFGAVVGVTMF
jgi:hypothetical protein